MGVSVCVSARAVYSGTSYFVLVPVRARVVRSTPIECESLAPHAEDDIFVRPNWSSALVDGRSSGTFALHVRETSIVQGPIPTQSCRCLSRRRRSADQSMVF